MNANVTFAGTLQNRNTRYYFEIGEDAYIEKQVVTPHKVLHDGHFTIEQARKCYKALLNKGYRPVSLA